MSLGIRPNEFWKLKPIELFDISKAYAKREQEKEKLEWKRLAWLATEIINISGKSVKHPIRPSQLIKFKDEERRSRISIKKRRKQAMETLRLHKSKFWTKIKGRSLDEIELYGEK